MEIFYGLPITEYHCILATAPDYNANDGRGLLDGQLDMRGESFSENHYRLDENSSERLGTPHLVFLSPAEPVKGIGCVSVGKIDIYGPFFVCTSKYRGWDRRQIEIAALIIQTIFLTSEGGNFSVKSKTLDEMLKEYGSKH